MELMGFPVFAIIVENAPAGDLRPQIRYFLYFLVFFYIFRSEIGGLLERPTGAGPAHGLGWGGMEWKYPSPRPNA